MTNNRSFIVKIVLLCVLLICTIGLIACKKKNLNSEIVSREYTVNYYLQNIDNGYTLVSTIKKTGLVGKEVFADIKDFTHFTYEPTISWTKGTIRENNTINLDVYYSRNTYNISSETNNEKAGSITTINHNPYFEEQVTLTATTNPGYTWLGWYEEENIVCESENFTFNVTTDVSYIAKWTPNSDTPYKVEYYLQNIENDHYSLDHCDTFVGTTDTIINAEIKDFPYFNYNPNMSSPKGKIDGDGSRILRIYYTRYKYDLFLNNNVSGTITNKGQYKYGEKVTSTASPYLGYVFSGWYNDEGVLLSTNLTYSFTIEQDVIAKFTVKSEMAEFTFASSWTFCKITGVKDKNANKIIIPDYVSSIGDYAFDSCGSLTSVEIPNSVTSIGSHAFDNCSSLTRVYITDLTSWCNIKFSNSSSTPLSLGATLYLNNQPITTLTIPNDVTSIGSSAFRYCSSLTSVVIPDSVTSIGSSAFGYCSSLTSVVIPDSVTSIGEGAFAGCSSLTSVVIPDSVTSIDSYAFAQCNSLTSVVIPDSVTSIGSYAFAWCNRLTSVVIPDSVTSIGSSAFDNCSSLKYNIEGNLKYLGNSSNPYVYLADTTSTSITFAKINDNCKFIGYAAFAGCSSLTSVVIPDSVTSIGSSAFGHCSSLTSVVIPDSVTSIGSSAFGYCSSLTSVVIPDSVTSIGSSAFSNCSSLTSIVIPDSVTSIGSSAFDNCSSLKYNIEGNLKYLGNSSNPYVYLADTTSTSITSAKINDNCKFIGYEAFYYCSSLTSVVIPNSVTSIGEGAFEDCNRLTSVVIPNSVISIGDFAFNNCDSLTSVVIPNSVTSIGRGAFNDCGSLTSVVIPESVTYIGSEAFYGCDSLTIYCKAKSKPINWSYNWNARRPVVWGYTGE